VLPLVVLAQLGVVIGIGVLLDTLLVRTVLVPSLVVLLGERFWWPRRVR
jgi:RND superfamily putative drug exporter